MASQSEMERECDEAELSKISGKPQNIEISALRTIECYKEEYRKHKVVPTKLEDYPQSEQGTGLIEMLSNFDRLVVKDKGITKKIQMMTVQPVTVKGETKYAVYYTGQYEGLDSWDNEIFCSFIDGWYYRPKMRFTASNTGRTKLDYDENGERRGEWKVTSQSIEHYIFLPEDKKERRAFLEKLFKDAGINPSACVFNYRRPSIDNIHSGQHGPISWNNFCDLTFEQMGELQEKGYYNSSGGLKDKDGHTMKWAHDKLEAVK